MDSSAIHQYHGSSFFSTRISFPPLTLLIVDRKDMVRYNSQHSFHNLYKGVHIFHIDFQTSNTHFSTDI